MNALYDSFLKKIERQGGWTLLYDEQIGTDSYYHVYLTPSHTILKFKVCDNVIFDATQIVKEV
jgi:hypothetical protein